MNFRQSGQGSRVEGAAYRRPQRVARSLRVRRVDADTSMATRRHR